MQNYLQNDNNKRIRKDKKVLVTHPLRHDWMKSGTHLQSKENEINVSRREQEARLLVAVLKIKIK